MKKYLCILIFIFISTKISFFAQIPAKVIGISDGDTITVLLENKSQLKIRLADVDCPESGQSFGKNAKQYTSSQVFGKMIVFYEIEQDRYGRTIAKVYYDDNKYLSAEIIRNGFGWWYERYSKDKNLSALQDNAKRKKLGLWQDLNPISPYDWRKQNKVYY